MPSKKKPKSSKSFIPSPTPSIVLNPKQPFYKAADLNFNFYYRNWLETVEIDDFTNKLKNQEEFAKHAFEMLNKLFPTLQESWDARQHRSPRLPHVHVVHKEKRELVEKIVKKIHGLDLPDDANLWQLGVSGGLRLICYYHASESTMYPLFVDYHHLLHSNVKHNQKDYKNLKFDPVEKFA